ncbi:extracellular solute-binding protein [Streptomyces sp. NPDC058299]|uniref:extracellular solute-binding protein n=1 Tax=Streptomyces sp. NPDC058299 TaxID=3346435 RepID=UPI0036E165E3
MRTGGDLGTRTILRARPEPGSPQRRMLGRQRFRERGGDDPLRLVGVEERVKEIDQGTALFEKKYRKVSVKTYFQTYESFWKKCRTQATGGNPPDVFQSAVTFLQKYDKRGILLDLRS